MSSAPVYNSQGDHIGDVFFGGGGGGTSFVIMVLETVVTSLILFGFLIGGKSIGMEVAVFRGITLENVTQNFPALSASCGIVTLSFLLSGGYDVALAKKALMGTLFAVALFSATMVVDMIDNPVLRLIPAALVWLPNAVFVALGALPALFMYSVLLPFCAVPDDMAVRILLIFVSGLLAGVLYRLFVEYVWPHIRYALSGLLR